MSIILKILNKFNRSHAGLRKFLRLLSYGCYHRNLFMKHNITPRSYDDLLRQVRFFVPEKNLQATRHDKCVYFTLIGDFRHGTDNFYCSSFKLKTFLPEQYLYKIILLQVLDDRICLTFPEIVMRLEKVLAEHMPDLLGADLPQILRRRLNELIDSGIVRRVELQKKIFYEKIPNPLGKLSAEEIQTLNVALNFFRNVSLLGTAGYFLCDSLKILYPASDSARQIFQFKNNNFARVLDDDILLTIIEAVRRRKKILIERESKPPLTVTPISVETDFLYSRQYLVALNQKELMRLRIEKIIAVRLTTDEAENFSPAQEKLRTIRLRVKFATPQEKLLRKKILTDELPCRIVEETADEFICSVETPDPLLIYPRLWKFQPWAEILTGADGLRERMLRDAREALKNYAKSV